MARMVTTVYKHNDLQGIRFGKLLVLSESGRGKDRHILWKCQCDCGNETVVSSHQLISGKTKSCGCYQREQTSRAKLKHGACGNHDNIDRLYKVWVSMRERCFTPSCKDYKDYGGRGISICQAWDDFSTFKTWAIENGYSYTAEFGKCTIDRIDVNGNYCPENCRWVGMDVQQRNKRNSKKMDGGTQDA